MRAFVSLDLGLAPAENRALPESQARGGAPGLQGVRKTTVELMSIRRSKIGMLRSARLARD
jgi:hypothetical protein